MIYHYYLLANHTSKLPPDILVEAVIENVIDCPAYTVGLVGVNDVIVIAILF